jgi:transcriptional regulator of acetoin/glycerol metabolism
VEKVDLQNWKAPSVREQIQVREMEELKTILEQSQGNIAEAARALGIARSTLFSRLKKYQLI